MLTVLDYANISQDVYGAPFTLNLYNPSSDKNIFRIREIPNTHMNPSNHFFAALYVKVRGGKVTDAVVAFRGTQNYTDDYVDYEAWQSDVLNNGANDQLPAYYPKARAFFRAARDYARQQFGLKVSLTGHSLGGALAQLVVAHAAKPHIAVTFNAPGIGNIPGVNVEHFAHYVHGINARYGFINKIGQPFGSIIYVNVPNEEEDAKAAFARHQDLLKTRKQIKIDEKAIDLSQSSADVALHLEEVQILMDKIRSDQIAESIDFTESCLAQHKIGNMIAAIKTDAGLAKRSFV